MEGEGRKREQHLSDTIAASAIATLTGVLKKKLTNNYLFPYNTS